MDKIFVFGHKNPDTDAVTSAISLSYLRNLNNKNTIPCILGEMNNETKFVLDYFKVPKPKYLNDTKIKVSDLNYNKDCYMYEDNTLDELYAYMEKESISAVPICSKLGKHRGIITLKELIKIIINPNYSELYTSYSNLLNIIRGKEVTKYCDEVKGTIKYFNTKAYDGDSILSNNDILLINKDVKLIQQGIKDKVQLIIVVGYKELDKSLITYARRNKVSIMTTMRDIVDVSRKVILSNYLKNVVNTKRDPIDENMNLDDFLVTFNKHKYHNYAIVDRKNKVLGLLSSSNINDINKKKVILVDHNEASQSVDGLDEARVLEIVDHHKVGNINSSEPINIRNMAVGSTNTIIYEMYKEAKVLPPKDIAGLMMAGIISDTLLFHSPTTTEMDRVAVSELSSISNVDPKEFSEKMFNEAASIKGKTIEEIIYGDFKAFNINKYKIGIGQMMVIDYQSALKNKDKYVKTLNELSKEREFDIMMFCITDVINNNTYVVYNSDASTILEASFDIEKIEEGYCLKGVVSRKKQIIPLLMDELN